jgi:hypothetical protein
MAPTFKKFIHEVDLNESLRSDLVFSDATKIRMYTDYNRVGVRLKSSYSKTSGKMEFPTDNDIYCEMPQWEPDAVKGWLVFQEISKKETGTSIGWRLHDGTSAYWYNGNWVAPSGDDDWNTEVEINDNISTFPYEQKKIKPIAKLKTTDKTVTPVLLSYRIMMKAQFDWWEDLVLRSIIPRLKEDMTFVKNFSTKLDSGTSTFNVLTDDRFELEEDTNIVGIDAIYNHDADPNHNTDLLDTFDPSTGDVTLTGALAIDTRVYIRYIIEPEIVTNFQNTDYTEVGKIPAVVIDSMNIIGSEVIASKEIVSKTSGSELGYKLDNPFHCREVSFLCVLMGISTVDSLRMITQSQAFTVRGATQRSGHRVGSVVKSKALDIYYTMRSGNPSRYNPRVNLGDLKTSTFEIKVENFYLWLREVRELPIIATFNYTVNDRADAGPKEQYGVTPDLNAGVVKVIYKSPDVEGL